jgi:hypothetical protein
VLGPNRTIVQPANRLDDSGETGRQIGRPLVSMIFAVRGLIILELDGKGGVQLRQRAARNHRSSAATRLNHLQLMGSAKGFDCVQVCLGRPMVLLELLPGGQLAEVDWRPLEIIQVLQRRAARPPADDQLDLGSFLCVRRSDMCGFWVRRTFAPCQRLIIGWNPSPRHFLAPQFVMLISVLKRA